MDFAEESVVHCYFTPESAENFEFLKKQMTPENLCVFSLTSGSHSHYPQTTGFLHTLLENDSLQ